MIEREIITILTRLRNTLQIASKIFGKVILKPLKFRKDSSSPKMTEQIQTLQLLDLRMHFKRSKSTLDSQKSVFNAFRRKPSLGAPEQKGCLI